MPYLQTNTNLFYFQEMIVKFKALLNSIFESYLPSSMVRKKSTSLIVKLRPIDGLEEYSFFMDVGTKGPQKIFLSDIWEKLKAIKIRTERRCAQLQEDPAYQSSVS